MGLASPLLFGRSVLIDMAVTGSASHLISIQCGSKSRLSVRDDQTVLGYAFSMSRELCRATLMGCLKNLSYRHLRVFHVSLPLSGSFPAFLVSICPYSTSIIDICVVIVTAYVSTTCAIIICFDCRCGVVLKLAARIWNGQSPWL